MGVLHSKWFTPILFVATAGVGAKADDPGNLMPDMPLKMPNVMEDPRIIDKSEGIGVLRKRITEAAENAGKAVIEKCRHAVKECATEGIGSLSICEGSTFQVIVEQNNDLSIYRTSKEEVSEECQSGVSDIKRVCMADQSDFCLPGKSF